MIGEGWSTERAATKVGVSANTGERWFAEGGGMPPLSLAEPSGRYLTLAEREYIDLRWEDGAEKAEIARELGRHPSTIGRELARNRLVGYPHKPPLPGGARRRPGAAPGSPAAHGRARLRYRAATAQSKAEERARRPKTSKLAEHPRLRAWVQQQLKDGLSPEQIAGRLPLAFPDDESMRISHEAIYQALYVQGRGELRRELTKCLRTGRALRKPRRRADARRERIKDKVMISERPAEAEDRAVPGHWEGDLIKGEGGLSSVGTLVERSTRFVLLLHLPNGAGAEAVRDAITDKITILPAALRRTLTWDQGIELARHAELTIAADLPVYFCDPHSPWQRGTNENTNGLLRQYLPKGSDLAVHTAADLDAIADRLNRRPRKTLGFKTPAEILAELLSDDQKAGVATTS
ncbi:MAG TPA: IS30 family transposase [Ramlibacter sp.]